MITLEARPTVDGDPDKQTRFLQYRFTVSVDGAPFRILSDFSRDSGFAWRPDLFEHEARIKVMMRNKDPKQKDKDKETLESELPFRILPRATGSTPVVSATAVPLIALFSAPPCPQGSEFRVAFHRAGDSSQVMRTSSEPCRGDRTSNVYVAGMLADTAYDMRAEVVAGISVQAGPPVEFRTGLIDAAFPPSTVLVPPSKMSSSKERFLLFSAARPTATDLQGNIVWYALTHEQALVRMLPGGRFLAITPGGSAAGDRIQSLTEFDLVGNVVRETNMAIIAEQVEKRMGIKSICKPNGGLCVAGLHHDAIRLPNGHTVAIGTLERMFPEGAQGSEDPTDIMGTLLIDLDQDLQVSWVWNAFELLDVSRKAIGDEKCRGKFGGLPCAPVYLGEAANDWLHTNSVSYTPRDGDLVVSLPEQNWVIKIDYNDGKGSGKVLWRLGDGGDLKPDKEDKLAWFSYQHDAAFEPPGSDTLVLFDNGHARQKKDDKKDDDKPAAAGKQDDKDQDAKSPEKPKEEAPSRGQVWKIDEEGRRATLLVNVDMGGYAPFMGSAQRLSNGNLHFTASTVRNHASRYARSVETTPDGNIVYMLETRPAYRSNRIADLYTPPR
ncbi:MAG TPA: aryl-sulfate sulfotransferase [Bryobacteraceae bacterium]|nr:aryl-sulfate sulfotransferase [Bryobacteraceae bacterium]